MNYVLGGYPPTQFNPQLINSHKIHKKKKKKKKKHPPPQAQGPRIQRPVVSKSTGSTTSAPPDGPTSGGSSTKTISSFYKRRSHFPPLAKTSPFRSRFPLNRAHLMAKHAPLGLHGADPTGDIQTERRDDGILRDVLIPVELRVRVRDVRVRSGVPEPGM